MVQRGSIDAISESDLTQRSGVERVNRETKQRTLPRQPVCRAINNYNGLNPPSLS